MNKIANPYEYKLKELSSPMISGYNLKKEHSNKKYNYSKEIRKLSLERFLRLEKQLFFRKQEFLKLDRTKKF
jgi:hypothetical protein